MIDLAPLHRRLRRSLDLSALLVAGALVTACPATQEPEAVVETKPDERKEPPAVPVANDGSAVPEPEVTPVPEPVPEPTPEPEPTPVPEVGSPEPLRNRPTCPVEHWCGPVAAVEPMRHESPGHTTADVGRCPGEIENVGLTKKTTKAPPGPFIMGRIAGIDAAATTAKHAAGEKDTCCYAWTRPCPGGRPLLIDGQPWIAGLRAGGGWVARLAPESAERALLPERLRERVAQDWLHDALTEHASIASFMRARAELQAIAAPRVLLDACERAAADEVEHARLCFGLAERYGAGALEPTALPEVEPRGGGAIAVALDTFVEGCVGETIAAACAQRAAAEAVDPLVRAVLERIAADETEHAALAWRTIAWLSRREGPSVLAAIERRAGVLRPVVGVLPAVDPEATHLLAHGRLDRRALARTEARAWRELIDPLLTELRGIERPESEARRGATTDRARA